MLLAGMPLLWRALLVTGWVSSASGTDAVIIDTFMRTNLDVNIGTFV